MILSFWVPGNLLKGELLNLQVANWILHQAHSGAYHSQGPGKKLAMGFQLVFISHDEAPSVN